MASNGAGMEKLKLRSTAIMEFPQDEFDSEVHPTGLNNVRVGVYRFLKGKLGKDYVVIFLTAYWPDEKVGIRKSEVCFKNLKKIIESARGTIELEDPKKPIGQLKIFRAVVRNLGAIKRGKIGTAYQEAIRQRRMHRARRQEKAQKRAILKERGLPTRR